MWPFKKFVSFCGRNGGRDIESDITIPIMHFRKFRPFESPFSSLVIFIAKGRVIILMCGREEADSGRWQEVCLPSPPAFSQGPSVWRQLGDGCQIVSPVAESPLLQSRCLCACRRTWEIPSNLLNCQNFQGANARVFIMQRIPKTLEQRW